MTDNTRHLVVEMSIGMLFYTVVLAVLAVVFKGGMARMGFSTGRVGRSVLWFCGRRGDVDPYGLYHRAGG